MADPTSGAPEAKRPRRCENAAEGQEDAALLTYEEVGELSEAGVQKWLEVVLKNEGVAGSREDETRGIGKVLLCMRKNEMDGKALLGLTSTNQLVGIEVPLASAIIVINKLNSMRPPVAPVAEVTPAASEEADLSHFFRSLQETEPDHNGILTIDNLTPWAQHLLYLVLPPGASQVRFLLRKEYERLYNALEINASSAAIVVGTSGIGKSAFRYYVLRQWMLGDLGVKFPMAIFNLGDGFYELDRDCKVRKLRNVLSLQEYDKRALALFDPCMLVSNLGKYLYFAYMLVTTSPSPLTGQESKVGSLTELIKAVQGRVHVMQGWTTEEVRAVHPGVVEEVIEASGCVPLWCMYPSIAALQEDIHNTFTRDKTEALYNFIKECVADGEPVRSENLPWRMVKIAASPAGWGATGFISPYVANLFSKRAQKIADGKTDEFVHMLRNPFGKQALGVLFEEWALKKMASGTKCELHGVAPMLGTFTAASTFERDDVTSVAKAGTKMDPGTLYRSPVGYATIDAYGIVQDPDGAAKQLLLLQDTVGRQHRAGLWNPIKHIVAAARAAGAHRVTLVYLVPRGESFEVPTCGELNDKGIEIVRGSLAEDMGIPLKVWGAGGP